MDHTNITDAGLKQLKGLTNLEYLNLYGTTVSDAGLGELASIKTLRTIYLWQTKITDSGAATLKVALPRAEINVGLEDSTLVHLTKTKAIAAENAKAR